MYSNLNEFKSFDAIAKQTRKPYHAARKGQHTFIKHI